MGGGIAAGYGYLPFGLASGTIKEFNHSPGINAPPPAADPVLPDGRCLRTKPGAMGFCKNIPGNEKRRVPSFGWVGVVGQQTKRAFVMLRVDSCSVLRLTR